MGALFLTILELSLEGALLIGLILLLRPLSGTYFSAKWRCLVWLILALRLLLPLSLPLPQTLFSIPLPPQFSVQQEVPTPDIMIPAIPQEQEGEAKVENRLQKPAVTVETSSALSLVEQLGWLWFLGILLCALWQFVLYRRYQKRYGLWNRQVEPEVQQLFQTVAEELGVKQLPLLRQNRRVESPMILGFFQPILLLPEKDYIEEDLQVIFSHELTHHKKKDLWYKLLLLLLRCVHWFNPMIYWMLQEVDNDLEIRCDEAVVQGKSVEERALYCEAILRILCRGKGSHLLLSTGFYGGKKVLQRRFAAVMNQAAGRGLVLGILLVLLTLSCSAFVALEAPTQPPEVEQVTSDKQNPNTDSPGDFSEFDEIEVRISTEYLAESGRGEHRIIQDNKEKAELNQLVKDRREEYSGEAKPQGSIYTLWIRSGIFTDAYTFIHGEDGAYLMQRTGFHQWYRVEQEAYELLRDKLYAEYLRTEAEA